MKVLYITDRDDKFGAPKAMLEMIIELRNKYKIEPIVITSIRNNVNDICDKNNIENHITNHQKHLYTNTTNKINNYIKYFPRYIRYVIGNFIAIKKINKKIDLNKIDIIHTNTSSLDIGAILSKKYNKKHIIHIREFGDKDFNMKSYRKNYIDFFNKNTNKYFAISDAIKKDAIEKGYKKERIIKIYDGISNDGIEIKDYKQSSRETKLKMIISGSICEGKGQAEIVKAIATVDKNILKNINLDIIGSGDTEYIRKIKKVIQDNNLGEIVKFLDYDKNIRKKIKNYDLGIVCSKSEGFGRITAEYMLSQVPVIASNKGANIEIIDNNKNGLLYEYNNIEDLANKINYVHNNKNILPNMGKKAREKILENFMDNKNSKNVYISYKELEGN